MLVSGVQQSDSVIFSYLFFQIISVIGYYKILNTAPFAIQEDLLSILYIVV